MLTEAHNVKSGVQCLYSVSGMTVLLGQPMLHGAFQSVCVMHLQVCTRFLCQG